MQPKFKTETNNIFHAPLCFREAICNLQVSNYLGIENHSIRTHAAAGS